MLVGREFFCLSELRAQTNLNAGHGPSLVPTISSRSGGVQSSGTFFCCYCLCLLALCSVPGLPSFVPGPRLSHAGAPRDIHD